MNFGFRILRLVIGAFFIGHGTQKLFGWFGGHGPEGTGQWMESIGLKPGKQNAIAAGAAESLGGLGLATGAATPVAAAALTGTMTTAIATAHAGKGPWVTDGGWEYNAVLIGALFAITEQRSGFPWAVAELVAGAGGALALLQLAPEKEEDARDHGDEPVPFVRAEEAMRPATA
jgi:putative oxidoreductase